MKLTPEEQGLLYAIATGLKPIEGTPELKKLEELGLVRKSNFSITGYVSTVDGDRQLPKRVAT